MNAIPEKQPRARPNWGVVTEIEARLIDANRDRDKAQDQAARSLQAFDALHRRVWPLAGVAFMLGISIGAFL